MKMIHILELACGVILGGVEGHVPCSARERESYDDGPSSISRKNKRGLVAAAITPLPPPLPLLLFCRLPEIPRHEIEEISVAAARDSGWHGG